ncbi:unnamed protein product, partial [Discosporangium mesarthrocarpum]
MSPDELEELYLASIRVPVIVVVFVGLWGLVLLTLQALRIDYPSVLTLSNVDKDKAGGKAVALGTPPRARIALADEGGGGDETRE